MMRQAAINVPKPKDDTRSLHEIRVAVIKEFGPPKMEQMARLLSASKGHLSEVMSGDGAKHWPDKWSEYIEVHLDHRCEIAAYHARLKGMVLSPPRKRTAAEELRRLRYTLGKHNGIGKAITEEADDLPDEFFSDFEQETP